MAKRHDYTSLIEWTGDRGQGTRTYRGYDRTWSIATPGKPVVKCSNDPLLGGDPRNILVMSGVMMIAAGAATLIVRDRPVRT